MVNTSCYQILGLFCPSSEFRSGGQIQEGGFHNSFHTEFLPELVFTPCLSVIMLLFLCLRWSSLLLSLLAEPLCPSSASKEHLLIFPGSGGRVLLSLVTALTALCYNCLFVSSPRLLLEGTDQAFLFSVTGTWEPLMNICGPTARLEEEKPGG